jgi:hemerythrin superfamily protein
MTSTYRSVAEQSEAERGGERSILSRQSSDHSDLQELMLAHDAATDPARRGALLAEVADRALRHAFAEETVLFPAYRQYLPSSGDVVTAHIESEHQAVNDSLKRLQDIDPQDPAYAELVSSTFEVIRDDARNEEDILLPQLQQVLTEDGLRKLGDAWEVARRTAPTRPHPKISRRPPGNVLAAPFLAVSDRVKDAVDAAGGARQVLRSAAIGMLAGAAGVAAMTASEKVEQRYTGRKSSYVPNQTLRRLLGAPSHQWRRWHSPADVATNHAMHWGQGAALGAVRGVMTATGTRGLRASLLFTGIRFGTDQALENSTGVGSPPWTWPTGELVADLWHKYVYARVTGLACDALIRPSGSADA